MISKATTTKVLKIAFIVAVVSFTVASRFIAGFPDSFPTMVWVYGYTITRPIAFLARHFYYSTGLEVTLSVGFIVYLISIVVIYKFLSWLYNYLKKQNWKTVYIQALFLATLHPILVYLVVILCLLMRLGMMFGMTVVLVYLALSCLVILIVATYNVVKVMKDENYSVLLTVIACVLHIVIVFI